MARAIAGCAYWQHRAHRPGATRRIDPWTRPCSRDLAFVALLAILGALAALVRRGHPPGLRALQRRRLNPALAAGPPPASPPGAAPAR